VKPGDSHISYLPMAHVMERAVFVNMTYIGIKIGLFGGDTQKITDDCKILKPSVFISVPRLFCKVYDAVNKNVSEQTDFKKNLFRKGIEAKLANLAYDGSVRHIVYDNIIFNKIRDRLGGNVRLMLTGSAPLDKEMLNFLKVAFCTPIIEAYGQTEGTAVQFFTDIYERKAGIVGGPQIQNEFKLVDIPELGYLSTDRDAQGNPSPRGEIWVRGPNVIRGYFLNDEKTRETISPDGWLMSGDVGQLLWPDNALKIIDRKKNIFKLQQGEYIAPEKLENSYRLAHPYINELFIYGDGLKTFIVAVIVMEPANITKFALENNIAGAEDPQTVKGKPEFVKAVLKAFSDCAKKNKFNSLENIKDVYVETKPFADLGLLNTAFKLKRHEANVLYKSQIDALYAKSSA